MPDDSLKPALRAALRHHEIGNASPYQLSFAGKGTSGASFGFMQGDLNAGQPLVKKTFHDALMAAGIPSDKIASLERQLAGHLPANPLTDADTRLVNDALQGSRALVDAMDEGIIKKVYDDLDVCVARATNAGCEIDPKALLYMGMWINMTGPPTKMLQWLGGGDPQLSKPVPPAGSDVDEEAIQTFLQATKYYTENPRNWPHMLESVEAGAVLLA